ncbi:MAG: menaquinone biosynthesis decarboxylase [Thermoprotei archaeon]
MVARDLHEYVRLLEDSKKLDRVKVEVDPELELAEVLRRCVKQRPGRAVLFEKVKGYRIPVLGNAFSSDELVAFSLGEKDLPSLGKKLSSLFSFEPPTGLVDALRSIPKLRGLVGISPKKVSKAPVKEIVEKDPSFDSIPITKTWPGDAGKFITFPLVVTRDPDTGVTNIGVYRVQIFDSKSATIHWQRHRSSAIAYRKLDRQGQRMDVALVVGADPATIFTGVAPVPEAIDEYLFAGFLQGTGIEVVKCETSDLVVPARAEIVLEGHVDPGEQRLEGPFGDHTGYYTPQEPYPVFHLDAITRREEPIYLTTVVGKPVLEDTFLANAAQAMFTEPLKLLFPEITDLYMPPEGVFTNLAFVSIKKQYPAHAKKIMMGLWGMPQLMFLKMIVVLDDDVNVRDVSEVLWAVSTRIDPQRDIVIIPDTVTDTLDHASKMPNLGSKMGVDATRKWPEEGYTRSWPDVVSPDSKTKQLVDSKWAQYFS